ncbi:MAG: outer membrane lipoprotein carrier protein LolA [Saprospiraceae bacterium]|nr:outer membrane lipoprotein carrier protein LolA [Saprospiraceae bacterium]HRD82695.1 outer membrane lipoprotein carrier protein LolA [Saprospiraceae bacterium]HRJ14138.1 outer membrane lipoprotein carrier protein LolA [Saprospiraceae bacterium]HRK82692.1 outer membrane lipoprotein carrier protein LolA [Saprospiraceae bacterium]
MTKKIWMLVIALFCVLSVHAQKQTGQFTKAQESDPQAKAVLDKLKKKYQGYQSLELAFTLEIELPDQKKEVQQGKIAKQGKKYRVDLASQSVICDGTALWLVLHNNKEVQINNLPDPSTDENILSPEALFSFYDKGKFVYSLVNEATVAGKVVQEIEFKPLDKGSEYAKFRLTVDKAAVTVVSMKAFGKDASRYTVKMGALTPNKTFAADFFSFSKSKFPGYRVEDLRD